MPRDLERSWCSQLRGRFVVGARGRLIGVVDDIEIDPASWVATALIVRVDASAVSALGLEVPFWSRARLRVPVDHVDEVTDIIALRMSVDELSTWVFDTE